MSAHGRFISLEGIEGAGKSTLAAALELNLHQLGLPVLRTREPGGTALAERLRTIALERGNEVLPAHAETLIMFAARAVHVENRIRPALAQGTWVICDRFTDASRAYQGAGRGVDGAFIESLATAVHADLWPDRTLLLDLAVGFGQLTLHGLGRVAVGTRFPFDLPDVLIDLVTVVAPHDRRELTRRGLFEEVGQLGVNVRLHMA